MELNGGASNYQNTSDNHQEYSAALHILVLGQFLLLKRFIGIPLGNGSADDQH
jgi:hypothetical protein